MRARQHFTQPRGQIDEKSRRAVEAGTGGAQVRAAITASIDLELQRVDAVRGIAMALDDIAAGVGFVEGDGPADGAGDARPLVGNPLRRAAAMAVADDQFRLAAPWGHRVTVEKQCRSVSRGEPIQAFLYSCVKRFMRLIQATTELGWFDLCPP